MKLNFLMSFQEKLNLKLRQAIKNKMYHEKSENLAVECKKNDVMTGTGSRSSRGIPNYLLNTGPTNDNTFGEITPPLPPPPPTSLPSRPYRLTVFLVTYSPRLPDNLAMGAK